MMEFDGNAVMFAAILVILTYVSIFFLASKLNSCSKDARRFYYVVGSIISGLGFWSHSYIITLGYDFPQQHSVNSVSIIIAFINAFAIFSFFLDTRKLTLAKTILISASSGVLIVFVHFFNVNSSVDLSFSDVHVLAFALSFLVSFISSFLFFIFRGKYDANTSAYVLPSLVMGALSALPVFMIIIGIDPLFYSEVVSNESGEISISDLKITIAVFATILMLGFIFLIISTNELRPTLGIKIGSLIAFLLVVAVTVTGTTVYNLIEDIKLKEFTEQARESLEYESDYFERTSVGYMEGLRLLSKHSQLSEFLSKPNGDDLVREEIVNTFSSFMRSNRSLWQLRLLVYPGRGEEVLRIQRFNNEVFVFNDKDLQAKAHRDYYKKTITLEQGEIYISEINLNREHGEIEVPFRPTYRMSTPIYRADGKLLGVIVINVDFDSLIRESKFRSSLSMTRYVINEKGEFLYHPLNEHRFGFEFGKEYLLNSVIPDASGILNEEVSTPPTRMVSIGGDNKLIGAKKAFYVPGDRQRWIGFVGVVEGFVIDNVKNSFLVKFVQLCSAFTLIALALVIALSRYVVRPIINVSSAYKEFTENGYIKDVEGSQDDEIGDLTQSFYELCVNVNRNETELTRRTTFLNTILQHTYDGIIVIDEGGLIHNMNKAAEKMFLCREKDMLGKNISQLLPFSIRHLHDQYIQNYLATGVAKMIGHDREVEVIRSDNEKIDIEIGVTELFQDGKHYFIGTLKDVTQRKLAETELRRRQLELGSILEAAIDGIFTVSDAGEVITANPAAHKLLGYKDNTLPGTPMTEFLPKLNDVGAAIVQKTIIGSGNETEASRLDGSTFSVELSISEARVEDRLILTCIMRDITERKNHEGALTKALDLLRESQEKLIASNQELEDSARTDPLTQIANRRYFDEVFEREFRRARRNKASVGVLMIDVDYFKAYNDHYGHQAGDECLKAVARVINESVKRPADLAARYGGEEFIVLMPEVDRDGLIIVANNIRQTLGALEIEHGTSGVSEHVTISIGAFLVTPEQVTRSAEIIKGADDALYDAKESGRNRVVFKDAA